VFVLVGQPQLGFSLGPLKSIHKQLSKLDVGTPIVKKILRNPQTRAIAAQTAAQYAQQKYPGQYAQFQQYAAQAQALRQQGQVPPPPPPGMMVPPMDEDAVPANAGPVQRGNITMLALLGGAALLIIFMMKK